jgi:hypothetical protein
MEKRSVLVFPALSLIVLVAIAVPLAAQAPTRASKPTFSLGGMLAATSQARLDAFEPYFGLRFLPKLDFSLPAGRGWTFDGEASANIFGDLVFPRHETAMASGDIKPYRGWLRLSSSRFEVRLGLQQLSFGSATLFRPLMWFDSLDPRDPLQITDGVYGLLVRAYAKSNANVWLWGLYGNTERRGFDLVPPERKSPEFGGRLELPLFKGEVAATYHHRKVDIGALVPIMSAWASPFSLSSSLGSLLLSRSARFPSPLSSFPTSIFASAMPALPGASPLPVPTVPEDRYGLDGKWDLGIGVWFEGVLIHQHSPYPDITYQRAYTLGADYTFALGRGLTVLAEHFRIGSALRAFAAGAGNSFTALLLRYPFGLSDELSGIFYYDWTNRGVYRFVGWTRRTDAITFSAIAFWNPASLAVFRGVAGSGSFAGTGLELILAYNF